MSPTVVPLTLQCADAKLMALLHRPDAALCRRRGVVIVLGAPQYRVGSHRQFLLLGRALAAAGFPVLRFDYRGVGDSDGTFAGFEAVDADLRTAIDGLQAAVPLVDDVILWGLCDGASAAAFYAASDERVSGLVLVNPWVRSEAGVAQARVRSYYSARLLSPAFWRKLVSGQIDIGRSLASFVETACAAFTRGANDTVPSSEAAGGISLPERVSAGLRSFRGRVLLILSGADLTAQEFSQAVLAARTMRPWVQQPSVTVRRLAHANHTYSTQAWRERVHAWTLGWLEEGGLPEEGLGEAQGVAKSKTRRHGP